MAITAVVSNGNLLLELDDGTVVNAGRVKGETGPIGLQGREGLRGSPGSDGRDGRDGASIHTGLGAPNPDDYNDGDIYIDVQTVDLLLYQKIGGQWARIGALKGQPGAPGAAGSDGAAGGGGSIIIDGGSNNGGDGPTVDNNGQPIQDGDLWFDPETGYIYVYRGSVWIPVSDHPPAIISDTPPEHNNASNENPTQPPQYDVVEGDLWFDSDQAALYVAAKDTGDNLVWVITIPADRSTLIPLLPVTTFVFPASATGTYVDDGTIVENTVTGVFYIYNASKNQWIDLPPRDRIGDCLNEAEKETVCDRLEFIQNEIIELEEEIDAIAPSVERGSWNFTLSGTISGPGIFTAYDEFVATSGNPIGLVTNIKSLWFHSIDNAGTPHGFDNVEPGNLLELFVEGKSEYGLFEVVEVHDQTGGAADYWVIDVNFVRTLEDTTRFDNGETCRLKIFEAPSGGDGNAYILKSGDTVEGELRWNKYKPASGSDPVENAYHGVRIYSRTGGDILFATTGGTYTAEELTTDLVPTTPASICNKEYVDAAVSPGTVLIADVGKWRYGGLEESTLERYQYFGLEKKGSTSTYIPYGNILYLDKLIAPDGTLQPLEDYIPTGISMLEVYVSNELYFKGLLNPTTYKVSSRSPDEIECEFTTEYALISKSSTDWSTTLSHRLILTGMKYIG